MRVLIVEDEAIIAMMLEDAVEQCGHIVGATVGNISDALNAVSTGDFDVALLDINLNGQRAHALPITLSAQRKPFAFITGYGEAGILSRFRDAPVLAKPFRLDTFRDVLARLETASGKDL